MSRSDSSPDSLPDAAWRQTCRRRLLAWFRRHARDLPWRRSRDPYRVWVSEIMLQQTQVATVQPYFERFLSAFPDLAALAAADLSEVLRLWEGLGYYRRARQLHEAARQVMQQHGGAFPRDIQAALRLPGIGRYTAGAILSIAFDDRQPILEANSVRVLSRLLAYRGDPLRGEGQQLLWDFAEQILPRKNVGQFNQAVMELGSEVCTARQPQCDSCPLQRICPTCEQGLQQCIPARQPPKTYEAVREAAVVVRRRGKVLLRRCGPEERWAGLWDFPRFVIVRQRGDALRRELAVKVRELTGVSVTPGRRLTTLKHGVTRFRITLICHEAEYLSSANGTGRRRNLRWARPAELADFPLSVTGRKISRLLQ